MNPPAIPISNPQEQQSEQSGQEYAALLPIVVDLDETVTPTDTLVESIVLALNPNLLNKKVIPQLCWGTRRV